MNSSSEYTSRWASIEMHSNPTKLPPTPVPRHAGRKPSWFVRKELLGNPDPSFAESAKRVGLHRATLYQWFPPTCPGHVVVKALLSRRSATLPEIARQLWVSRRTLSAWFPPAVKLRLLRCLLHSGLSLAQVARRLGGPAALDAWLPPGERFRIAPEVLGNPDPRFAESARRAGLSSETLYWWFRPTFPGHVVVKALLSSSSLTLPQVARRLWVSPAVVHAWFPPAVKRTLLKFLLLRSDLPMAQVAHRLGIPIGNLQAWFSPTEWAHLAEAMMLRFGFPLGQVARRLSIPVDTLRKSLSPKRRVRLVKALMLRVELSLDQVADRLGVPIHTLRNDLRKSLSPTQRSHLVRKLLVDSPLSLSQAADRLGTTRSHFLSRWLPPKDELYVAGALLRSGLSLAQVADRLGVPQLRFDLQRLPPREQRHFVRTLLVHTNLPAPQMAQRLGVPIETLGRWIPNLTLKGADMTTARRRRRIGYARVSTLDQDPEHQTEILKQAGCDRIFVDYACGSRVSRPELGRVLEVLETGDTLMVWRFDRLGRSLQHLIDIVTLLDKRKIQLRSLTENIDTHTAAGRMVFSVMGALAEFERSLISERTKLAAMRRHDKHQHWGRPSQFHDPDQVKRAQRLLRSELPRSEVARRLGISLVGLYRWFPKGKAENFGKGERKPRQPKG